VVASSVNPLERCGKFSKHVQSQSNPSNGLGNDDDDDDSCDFTSVSKPKGRKEGLQMNQLQIDTNQTVEDFLWNG
jgi:hypothetical protein